MTWTDDTDTFAIDEGEYISDESQNGQSHAEGHETIRSETYRKCAAEDCTNPAFTAAKGSGKRSSQYCRQDNCTRKTGASRRSEQDEDPFSAPLSSSEQRLAKSLELPIRLIGATVYRANMIDGLIIGDNAKEVAEAWVLEGRVSKTAKEAAQAVAKFAGAGPLALVGINISLQIASNHKIPVIGGIKPVSPKTLEQAERIERMRSGRAEQQKRTVEAARVSSATPHLVTCPSCGRTNILQPNGGTSCMCGVTIING